MHELALSETIVATAREACRGRDGRLARIGVEVGALSAVSEDALRFWMELALKRSGIENVEVCIASVPARAKCECGSVYEAEDVFSPCPRCGSFSREVVSGMDVTVKWIEVEDEENDED